MEPARQGQFRSELSTIGTASHEPVEPGSTSAVAETGAQAEEGNDNDNTTDTRLHIHAFFAASDMLIGAGGKTYFDQCFADAESSSSIATRTSTSKPRIDEFIKYESETVPGTNHETIVELLKGVVGRVFEEVVEAW